MPSLPQTKVTALNGKPAGPQYLPSYLSLSSWYSPSQCYLQLQPPSRPLQVRLSGGTFLGQGWARDRPCTCLQGTCMCPSRANGDADAGVPIPPARGVLLKMNAHNLFMMDMKAVAQGLP